MSTTSIADLIADLDLCPASDPSWAPELKAWIKDELRELIPPDAPWTSSDPLVITKYGLADVLACEERFMLPSDFEWSEATLRGRAAHQAIRFLVATPGLDAWTAADLAIHELAENDTPDVKKFISEMSDPVRGDFLNRVATSVDEFAFATEGLVLPPVKPEYPMRFTARTGVVVTGRVDLVLGQPKRQKDGPPIRSFAHLELKTGIERPQEHTEDSRLYALLDLLKTNVAPGHSAVWYLESGEILPVLIDHDSLWAAAGRLVEGITKMVNLKLELAEPTATAGWRCNRCPISDTCTEGMLRARARRES